jgi:tetraacyldisaccharide 4'-kinase
VHRVEPVRVGAPVIVVGNFTVGGTGTTPLVIDLARDLRAAGWRPGVVSRGYGRRRGAGPLRVTPDTPVADSGDEPALIAAEAGSPVFVDAAGVAAARAAVAAGCNVVIADDGLQHRRLARDIEIEVVDAARGYGNGLLLPAGPLREPPRPCDLRVVRGGDGRAGEYAMGDMFDGAYALDDPAVRRPLSSFAGMTVQAVAGIGNPGSFFRVLHVHGMRVEAHPFPDHHDFVAGELEALPRPLLMTAKDAIKCRGRGLRDAWVVPLRVVIAPAFFERVRQLLGSP